MVQIVDAVIPAAGFNKRLENLRITRLLPKSMIPIIGKPVIEYIVDFLVENGIENIYIIVGNKKESIISYFGNGDEFGVKIRYLFQENANGIAMALTLAKEVIGESFLCVLGDTFIPKQRITTIFETSQERNAVVVQAVVQEFNKNRIQQSCNVVLGNGNKILDIIEKPLVPTSSIRGSGIYIFKREIFNYITETPKSDVTGQVEISDTIKLLSRQGKAFYVMLEALDVNINVIDDLLLATQMALKDRGLQYD